MIAHLPVLLQEIITDLEAKSGETILDATVGGGGHSEALCKAICSGRFVCLDADEDAIERSRKRLASCSCEFLFYRTYYRALDQALQRFGISGINRALFDLGLSSFQLEESGRGFSFMRDEPLEMTFSKMPEGVTAKDIVNTWSEETIATLLKGYGEETQAMRIARRIVEAREQSLISTTLQLAQLVESVVKRRGKIHPATKTFQALRMAVNDEFRGLKEGLSKAWNALLPHGRLAVISFHSIEDRTVKDFFRERRNDGSGVLITKKPIVPTSGEVTANPRARSAKLRIIEKI